MHQCYNGIPWHRCGETVVNRAVAMVARIWIQPRTKGLHIPSTELHNEECSCGCSSDVKDFAFTLILSSGFFILDRA